MDELAAYLAAGRERVEAWLAGCLPERSGAPAGHVEAMRYSLMAGGKRVRPVLVMAAYETVAGTGLPEGLMPVPAAIECIHTYSLVHDDLPAMDDDDLRRGVPTSHVRFGEAGAILAGDALLTFAFELLARPMPMESAAQLRVVNLIARAAGPEGMTGGQFLDLEAEGGEIGADELEGIHELKTGALITASLQAGALAAGATPEQFSALTRYGRAIGLAFQIADDLLNVESTPEVLGKAAGSDAERGKATYPGLLGPEGAREKARACVDEATAAMGVFSGRGRMLELLAAYVIERKN